MTLYYPNNARSPQQAADMAALETTATCIFCDPDEDQPMLYETAHWYVTVNEYPYVGTREHLLLVPRVHAVGLNNLPLLVRGDFWSMLDWMHYEHELTDYTLKARNGDPVKTGGTIEHLHVHAISY